MREASLCDTRKRNATIFILQPVDNINPFWGSKIRALYTLDPDPGESGSETLIFVSDVILSEICKISPSQLHGTGSAVLAHAVAKKIASCSPFSMYYMDFSRIIDYSVWKL